MTKPFISTYFAQKMKTRCFCDIIFSIQKKGTNWPCWNNYTLTHTDQILTFMKCLVEEWQQLKPLNPVNWAFITQEVVFGNLNPDLNTVKYIIMNFQDQQKTVRFYQTICHKMFIISSYRGINITFQYKHVLLHTLNILYVKTVQIKYQLKCGILNEFTSCYKRHKTCNMRQILIHITVITSSLSEHSLSIISRDYPIMKI